MKSTMAYAAKRALFTAMAAQTGTGQPLEGVQVSYAYPGRDITRKAIYGGGVRSNQVDAAGEQGLVGNETVTIGVYIRVLRADPAAATVLDADTDVETCADALSAIFAANPYLGGNMTWIGITTGNGDYAITPDGPESVLSLQVLVGAVLV